MAFGDNVALARLESSNLPSREKSYFEKLMSGLGSSRERITSMAQATKKHLESGATAVRQLAESGGTALGLAAVDVYNSDGGLDVKGKYPIDAGVALLGIGGSVALAGHEAAATLRSIGNTAFSILAFRKSHAYFSRSHVESGGTPSGSMASPVPTLAGGTTTPATHFGDDANTVLARLAAEL